MNPNKALWEKGDFTRLADNMRESGEALVDEPRHHAGASKVLDLGCGDGTTALPEAKRGADVLGVDIARNLVEAGNRRAQEAGPRQLQFPGRRCVRPAGSGGRQFDLVVSIFGAMFAPKPFDVAKEMVRVTQPGGRIVMGNWIPNDPTLVAQILKISSSYSPPPPEGFISPMTWGVETNVVERFAAAGIPAENDLLRARHLHLQLRRHARRSSSTRSALLRPDDECLRGRRARRPRRRAAERAGDAVPRARTRAPARTRRPFRRRSCASPSG